MKTILLTQNKVALVDDEDYERLNQYKWYAKREGNTWYVTRGSKKLDDKGKQKLIRMHREIMNAPKGVPVDHKNGNGLDNQKYNLRLATNQQNQFNRKNPQSNNKLGIKGVRWDGKLKKFKAGIKFNGKSIHLGYFSVLGDADSAYRIAEEKYFGKFSRNK